MIQEPRVYIPGVYRALSELRKRLEVTPIDQVSRELDPGLAEHRDAAYQRLLALCGTRSTAPRWGDIQTLLREREQLYAQLKGAIKRSDMIYNHSAEGRNL